MVAHVGTGHGVIVVSVAETARAFRLKDARERIGAHGAHGKIPAVGGRRFVHVHAVVFVVVASRKEVGGRVHLFGQPRMTRSQRGKPNAAANPAVQ